MLNESKFDIENVESSFNNFDIDDITGDSYSFFISSDKFSLKITRLGYSDQLMKRGNFSDGNRIMHYELEKDALLSISLADDKLLNWSSPLTKGAYKFSVIGDELETGIINKLSIQEKEIS